MVCPLALLLGLAVTTAAAPKDTGWGSPRPQVVALHADAAPATALTADNAGAVRR
ncbi:hypothetical protein ACWEQL_18720 [Kitasatospora sp. NPDC004240]